MAQNTGCKRKPLSVREKLDIIAKVDANPNVSRTKIAEELCLPVSTVNSILSKRKLYLCEATTSQPSRKKLKKSKYEKIETVLLEWFKQKRALNIPIGGPLLKQKADEIALRLNIDFKPSNGWLDRFKKRAGLTYKAISGESKSVNQEQVETWRNGVLPTLLADYEPRNVFNADECGLFFNLLPDRTYAFVGESCHGGKRSKDRITVLCCANMDGSEKLPLLVVGKAEKPRCFKNVKSLPCTYRHSKNAWMTCKLFNEFLVCLDRKMATRNRKILMFVDQCAAHPKDVDLMNVRVEFLPANTASVLQPMDQGVIQAVKQKYRRRLVSNLLHRLESKTTYKVSLFDAISMLAASWHDLSSETVANCYRRAGFSKLPESQEPQEQETVSNDQWVEVQGQLNINTTFEEFVHADDKLVACEIQEVEDLCNDDGKSEEEDENVDAERDQVTEEVCKPPTCREAKEHLEKYRHFLSSIPNVPESIMKSCMELETYTAKLCDKKSQQAKIDSFFKRT